VAFIEFYPRRPGHGSGAHSQVFRTSTPTGLRLRTLRVTTVIWWIEGSRCDQSVPHGPWVCYVQLGAAQHHGRIDRQDSPFEPGRYPWVEPRAKDGTLE